MFQVEANSKQIPWLRSPILYNYAKYNLLVDGLVLFTEGNDDLPARCQISSVPSSFICPVPDLLITLFVVTLHGCPCFAHLSTFDVKGSCLTSANCSSCLLLLEVWYILFYGL